MIEQHAEQHIDRIHFPLNQGKDYIIERGKYTKMAYGRLQNNWQNAEDAVQEAYLMLLTYPVHTKTDKEYEALFTSVLQGVIGKMYRNEKGKERNMLTSERQWAQYLESEYNDEEVVAVADEEANPETYTLADEMLERITAEINKLKFNHRQVVALSVLYGYKPSEIVDITGTRGDNVRKIIQRFRVAMEEKTL